MYSPRLRNHEPSQEDTRDASFAMCAPTGICHKFADAVACRKRDFNLDLTDGAHDSRPQGLADRSLGCVRLLTLSRDRVIFNW
jgi:hypothetical protein